MDLGHVLVSRETPDIRDFLSFRRCCPRLGVARRYQLQYLANTYHVLCELVLLSNSCELFAETEDPIPKNLELDLVGASCDVAGLGGDEDVNDLIGDNQGVGVLLV